MYLTEHDFTEGNHCILDDWQRSAAVISLQSVLLSCLIYQLINRNLKIATATASYHNTQLELPI